MVSPVAEIERLRDAYRRLSTLILRMPPPRWIDVLGVRSIGPINPIAKDVLANHSRAPGPNRGPIRWGDTVLGSLSIEEAYLDPLRATARSENDGLRVLE